MSDDHTSQAVGAYGGRLAELNPTPTIDTLAAEGVVLDNAFAHNAICTPSRRWTVLFPSDGAAVGAVVGIVKLALTSRNSWQMLVRWRRAIPR